MHIHICEHTLMHVHTHTIKIYAFIEGKEEIHVYFNIVGISRKLETQSAHQISIELPLVGLMVRSYKE